MHGSIDRSIMHAQNGLEVNELASSSPLSITHGKITCFSIQNVIGLRHLYLRLEVSLKILKTSHC